MQNLCKVLGYTAVPIFFNVICWNIYDSSPKTVVLVHIVGIDLVVFSKHTTVFKNIYFGPYMPQLLWKQGRISIGSRSYNVYHEEAVTSNVHCVHIIQFIQFLHQAKNMCLHFFHPPPPPI